MTSAPATPSPGRNDRRATSTISTSRQRGPSTRAPSCSDASGWEKIAKGCATNEEGWLM